jgi:hypothetical protein
MSERPDTVANQPTAKEDDLLGVIADVEKQLSSLRVFRAEREEAKHKLEQREAALVARQQELTELAGRLSQEQQKLESRRQQIESGEREMQALRSQAEQDRAAARQERDETGRERAKVVAELEHQTRLLVDREQRLTEGAAGLSRQRAELEQSVQALAERERALQNTQQQLDAMRTEVEQARAAAEEARSLARTREEDLEVLRAKAQELIAQVAAARAESQQVRGETEGLKTELARSAEAQSTLMQELAAREQKLQDKRGKLKALAAEYQKTTAGAAQLQEQLEGFKRQLIERDERVQDLSQKLAAATTKLREVSQHIHEQADIIAEAEGFKQELDQRQARIAELERELESARGRLKAAGQQAQSASTTDSQAKARIAELEAETESLENELRLAHTELNQALTDNRALQEQLASAHRTGREVPSHIGEAVTLRWSRLRLMRNILRDQAAKLQQASDAVRRRYEECEQILGQKESIATTQAALAEARRKLDSLQRQAGKTKAGALVFYAVLSVAILMGISWAVAGVMAPATFAARAIVAADTKGEPAGDDQLAEWQSFHEAILSDPRLLEVAAERMQRRGIAKLGSPGELDAFLKDHFSHLSASPGQLTLELRGQNGARMERILDTYVAALSSQANAAKDRRADGLGTTVIQTATTGPGPISDSRVVYAMGVFIAGLAASLFVLSLLWKRLTSGKSSFEHEQLVDATLAEATWRQAADTAAAGRD